MNLQILMFKTSDSDLDRPFIALQGSNEKPFAPLQVIEDIEKSGLQEDIAHKTIHHVIMSYLLGLLNEGFEYDKICSAIDDSITGFKTAGSDCSDWIYQLNAQRRALDSANSIYLSNNVKRRM